jgi:serine/threonine-protein phosphatase 2A regulatory subunit B
LGLPPWPSFFGGGVADKTVKLWKVNHRTPFLPRAVSSWERERKAGTQPSSSSLRLPTAVRGGAALPTATPRALFENAHAYNINSLSVNSDGRTFLSADDLRVHWWDLDVADKCFNVVDLKPKVARHRLPRPHSRIVAHLKTPPPLSTPHGS